MTTQTNSDRYYLLGQAVARFDPDQTRLTPGCVGNLATLPSRAPVILRHVWAEMLATPAVAELLNRIDWPSFRRDPLADMSFYLGYHRGGRA